MAFYSVTTVMTDNHGRRVWFPFEHPAETLADLHGQLVRDGSLHGRKYRRSGDLRIEYSRDTIITPATIVELTPFNISGVAVIRDVPSGS